MLQLVLVIAIAFVLQALLSGIQMKHFSDEFVKLRRQGKVAVGRKAGGFHAGAIVMFLIDDKGKIRKGKKLEGVTFLARVKDFPGFEGRYVGALKKEDGPRRSALTLPESRNCRQKSVRTQIRGLNRIQVYQTTGDRKISQDAVHTLFN